MINIFIIFIITTIIIIIKIYYYYYYYYYYYWKLRINENFSLAFSTLIIYKWQRKCIFYFATLDPLALNYTLTGHLTCCRN